MMDVQMKGAKIRGLPVFQPHMYLTDGGPQQRLEIKGIVLSCDGEEMQAQATNLDLENVYIIQEDIGHPAIDAIHVPQPPQPKVFLAFRMFVGDNGQYYSYTRPPKTMTTKELIEMAEQKFGRRVFLKEEG